MVQTVCCLTHTICHIQFVTLKMSHTACVGFTRMKLFQRDEKTKYGSEVYLWYLGTENSWRFSTASDFHERKNVCFMYNESQREYY